MPGAGIAGNQGYFFCKNLRHEVLVNYFFADL